MIDPGAAQAIVKQLNRWYRKKAKPHGAMDHFYRGTRMNYTAAYRGVTSFMCSIILLIATIPFFAPDIFADKSPYIILLLKMGWCGIVLVAIYLPLHAFRDFTVINDEGLIGSNHLGRETRLGWKDIYTYQIKSDDNRVIFRTHGKAKLTMSLSCDGWQDFLEMAARHLNPALFWQLNTALANVDTKSKQTIPGWTKKARWAKWISFGRKS
jgi:hypothetical protein